MRHPANRNGVGLFWYNGKEWKSKKIDEASKKGATIDLFSPRKLVP